MHRQHESLFSDSIPFDHDELMRTIGILLQEYPFLDLHYLGTSILGRGIPILILGNGSRKVLYIGAHHAMEWITSQILCRFLRDFCDTVQKQGSAYRIPAHVLLETHTIYIIPMLNPDGIDYQIHGVNRSNPLYERLCIMNNGSENFSHWQANARGVDLNHNYSAGFEEYKILEAENGIKGGAPTRFSGESPESEPEVSALCNFIRFHSDLRGIMTLHTQGEEIYFKSGNKELPKSASIAKKLSLLSGYKLSVAEGLASMGGLTDWCVQKMNIPSFTLECGMGTNPLPQSDAFSIYACLREAFFRFPILL